ncbi:50S ribosomal protein L28 [Nocardia terpenica]|nr:50S ribosomal protein L28 [Nocardia terpenica]MBF6063262.1 50S ribosomal protein L28 [Nocardia terpenica]MBF6105818.1 50S ribosomal protein L28 [Nocardia terpenica]MBF6113598.1 50S ribosomal protein L28 [Nocardia terpenica]MBF6119559.1 50S ribosomal protein L28 [Nocardia terpenica]MBF6151970.1 50S ribosomal protein L28 [Nocardia terpenica]
MSKHCDVCSKEPRFGRQIARLGVRAQKRRIKGRSARMFYPNIQSVKTVVNGTSMRLNVCTSCLKAGKVARKTSLARV